MTQFIILSLPRSRSFWLSAFLSPPGARCGHDLAASCGSVADWEGRFAALNGSVETGAMVGWRVLRHRHPDANMIVVRRPARQVWQSFAQRGVMVDPGELILRALMLDEVAQLAGVEVFGFDELGSEASCVKLFELCYGRPPPESWWADLAGVNLQIDLGDRVRQLAGRQAALAAFKQEVASLERELAPKGSLH